MATGSIGNNSHIKIKYHCYRAILPACENNIFSLLSLNCEANLGSPTHPISPEFIETKYLLSHPITSISNKFIQICRDPLKISDIGENKCEILERALMAFAERFYQLIRSTAPSSVTCDLGVRLNHCKFYFATKFLSFLCKLFISGFKAELDARSPLSLLASRHSSRLYTCLRVIHGA